MQTEELVRTSRVVEDHIGKVLDKSKAVFEQSKEIAASQSAVLQAQEKMKEGLSSSMAFLGESYDILDQGIAKLQRGTLEIQREIHQRQLLDGQSQALQRAQVYYPVSVSSTGGKQVFSLFLKSAQAWNLQLSLS
ncbi:hypothetical protein EJ110_NYTH26501 [Nymphaea thermarum]|nr:hypothetical protein EJ110_NYTH26501 [Nymphaea thermarum]